MIFTTPKLKFRKKVGWVFQVNGLGHDPEIENLRKISGWVFQDLTIRVNYNDFAWMKAKLKENFETIWFSIYKMRDETLPCFWFSTSLFLFFGIIVAKIEDYFRHFLYDSSNNNLCCWWLQSVLIPTALHFSSRHAWHCLNKE